MHCARTIDLEDQAMPIHDWTKVDAGIFHHFHHSWIHETKRALNRVVESRGCYTLLEHDPTRFRPELQAIRGASCSTGEADAVLAGETDLDFYRRKQKVVAVRHVSGDDLVAVVEIVSPGNKAGIATFRDFVEKAGSLISLNIHLLIIDLFPPTKRDPEGIHGAIWEDISGQEYRSPRDKPLTLAACDSSPGVRAYVEHVAVGDPLFDMPLFLEPGGHVAVPLEETYLSAWEAVPRRWQRVIEPRI
jgi:hypothetical protein